MDAEVDFGEAWIDLAGQRTKCFVFAFRLAYSGKAVHRITSPVGRKRSSMGTCTLSARWAGYPLGRSVTTI
jgi:hypothetical protein